MKPIVKIVTVLAALLAATAPVLAQAPRHAAAPRAIQTEFEGFIAKFRSALKANDSASITAMTHLPFDYTATYPDKAAFLAKGYPAIFTAKTRGCLQRTKAVYGRDGLNNDSYFLICGEDIFVFTRMPNGFVLREIGQND